MSHTATLTVDRPGIARRPSYAPRLTSGRVAWLPWSNAGAIATANGERDFVTDLASRAGDLGAEATRSDTTAVLNALRGGLSTDQLFANAPGLRPERLYRAYQELEERRRRAAAAWSAIVADPTRASLEHHGEDAARLVPVLVHRLLETADVDPALLPRVAARLAHGVDEVRRLIRNTEVELDRRPDPEHAMALSRALYNPMADCIFGRVEHLPERVGCLMPTRVAALLAEHVEGPALRSAS